ncbi:hypothetical protein BDV26DRAFT_298939 [Aspergillus bertholletiae]|uniref:Cyanovirin-N domain-containing protein n=1 Tax=Aspergillus bertholletiae TaxID=1226010 RepID=A0A5N7AN62_9EURO|nr:hypothetical protein BDV26DRAFT_298939 [Aspergillus bertholletiae]
MLRGKFRPAWVILAITVCEALAYPNIARDASMVLDSPNFPAPALEGTAAPGKRAFESLKCDFSHGLAYIDPTAVNIDHLRDEKDAYCLARAGNCARLSYLNDSSIWFCNYNLDHISTKCENLIKPAQTVYQSCQIASQYTYGYLRSKIWNGTESEVDYYLLIGPELLA